MNAWRATWNAPNRVRDATANCSRCFSVFIVNQTPTDCQHHPGELWLVDISVRDRDLDDAEITMLMCTQPGCFEWSCCNMSGEYLGCTKGVGHSTGLLKEHWQTRYGRQHLSPFKENPKFKHRRVGQHREPVKDLALSDVTDGSESSAGTYASESEDGVPKWRSRARAMGHAL
jgi:hypothetical protein